VKDDDSQSANAEPEAPAAKSDASSSPEASDTTEKSTQETAEPEKDAQETDAAEKLTENAPEKGAQDGDAAKTPGETDPPESWRNTILWAVGIAIILCAELFIYGHNGRIQVCVGVDTLTDYALRAEPRTKENAKKHPFCAERLNLGMWSSKDELSQAALNDACTAAARVVGQEHRQKCLRKDEPWTRFVEQEHVMPWDARLYRRLLWLD
jgi:hypothetical protein